MEEYLTTQEIASVLKVHLLTVRRWIGRGKLPATFLGKEYRIRRSDFDEFLSQRQGLAPRKKL